MNFVIKRTFGFRKECFSWRNVRFCTPDRSLLPPAGYNSSLAELKHTPSREIAARATSFRPLSSFGATIDWLHFFDVSEKDAHLDGFTLNRFNSFSYLLGSRAYLWCHFRLFWLLVHCQFETRTLISKSLTHTKCTHFYPTAFLFADASYADMKLKNQRGDRLRIYRYFSCHIPCLSHFS